MRRVLEQDLQAEDETRSKTEEPSSVATTNYKPLGVEDVKTFREGFYLGWFFGAALSVLLLAAYLVLR